METPMTSTPAPKIIESHDALIARADEQLARVTEQLATMERDSARPASAGPSPQSALERPGLAALVGLPRVSLSLRWFCSRPMAARPSWSSPVRRRNVFQLHHCCPKIRRFLRSPLHLPFNWPRRRQHDRKQRPWHRPHRKRPRRQLPKRFPTRHSCCKRSHAVSLRWSEISRSSRRARTR
jgi:hypothetical protein